MRRQSSKSLLRAAFMLMALLMLTLIPIFASAEGTGGAKGIKVYVTISDKGTIAKTNDGEAMAWKEVTVTDLDKSGDYTYYEALVAAHKAYNSEDGFAAADSGWVSSVWGVENNYAGYYFTKNGKAIPEIVTKSIVNEGDYLLTSVSQDTLIFADWACSFDGFEKNVKVGEEVPFTLKGFPSMTLAEATPAAEPVSVGIWENGAFVEKTKTDGDGKVSLTFDKPGRYVVTATGKAHVVFESTDEYTLYKVADPIWGKKGYDPTDWSEKEYVGYTLTDHDQGPYPYEEINWLTLDEYKSKYNDGTTFDLGYLLYSGKIEYDCPVIAPCCIVNVNSIEKADISVASATYNGKALTPAVTVKLDGKDLTKGTDYTVNYSNNKNAGTAKVTVTGIGMYFGQASKNFTIKKAKQPMSVKIANKTFKAKALKKNAKSFKAVIVNKNQGAVTYKATMNKKAKKALKFTNCKITVKKKTKKGTYTVKVRITAKGNANYLSGYVDKVIKVKVK